MPSYALISVSDKTGLAPFARGLADLGYQLLSTGGTARALQGEGLAVTQVADVTGFPEMLDGRVKTLHPRVHGGILARRDRPEHLASLEEHGIPLIDLVVVNLYPFAKAAADPGTDVPGLIEQIDIGGPGMVRAAAKNFRDVLVLVDPADYARVLAALSTGAPVPQALRIELARKAFAHTGAYDQMIAAELAHVTMTDAGGTRTPVGERDVFPEQVARSHARIRTLRYGENPHQPAAWYADGPTGFGNVTIHQGKELSFTNLLDLDAAARIVLEFSEPAASVIKHTNPCGVATGSNAADAYVRARDADPLSAFGGIIGLNRTLDVATAQAIVSTFIEAVVAPDVEEAARTVLAKKANLRVVTADFSALAATDALEWRSILGATLVQQRDRVIEARAPWSATTEGLRVVTKRQPTSEEWQALRFAWRVCAHVKSNTILFASADRTLGVGAGQMSRVDSVKVAMMKAGEANLKGSVVASDAFFPFRDGLDAVAAAGATAVVQPGGSVRDDEVIAAADEHGIAMVFTGRRHFRH